jgi:hypothetical protein
LFNTFKTGIFPESNTGYGNSEVAHLPNKNNNYHGNSNNNNNSNNRSQFRPYHLQEHSPLPLSLLHGDNERGSNTYYSTEHQRSFSREDRLNSQQYPSSTLSIPRSSQFPDSNRPYHQIYDNSNTGTNHTGSHPTSNNSNNNIGLAYDGLYLSQSQYEVKPPRTNPSHNYKF